MIRLRHIGVVVSDLDRTIQFYEDIFSLKLSKRIVEEGEYIEKLVNIKNASIEWAKMCAKDGTIIEFLQYSNVEKDDISDIYPKANRLGCSHIAMSVDDIDLVYKKLVKYGCKCNSEPLNSPDGNVKVMYCYDLDGCILEIVQEMK